MNDITRPDWDTYFLALAYVISKRSFDPNTSCGAILVSEDKKILSTGYNGPIKGSIDSEVPITRPDKYYHFIHAEENCLLTYYGSRDSLKDSVLYCTSRPCHKCLRMIIQKGINNITYAKLTPASCVDVEDINAQNKMISYLTSKPNIIEYKNNILIIKMLESTIQYVRNKSGICDKKNINNDEFNDLLVTEESMFGDLV